MRLFINPLFTFSFALLWCLIKDYLSHHPWFFFWGGDKNTTNQYVGFWYGIYWLTLNNCGVAEQQDTPINILFVVQNGLS